jgi:hypothetical protein
VRAAKDARQTEISRSKVSKQQEPANGTPALPPRSCSSGPPQLRALAALHPRSFAPPQLRDPTALRSRSFTVRVSARISWRRTGEDDLTGQEALCLPMGSLPANGLFVYRPAPFPASLRAEPFPCRPSGTAMAEVIPVFASMPTILMLTERGIRKAGRRRGRTFPRPTRPRPNRIQNRSHRLLGRCLCPPRPPRRGPTAALREKAGSVSVHPRSHRRSGDRTGSSRAGSRWFRRSGYCSGDSRPS